MTGMESGFLKVLLSDQGNKEPCPEPHTSEGFPLVHLGQSPWRGSQGTEGIGHPNLHPLLVDYIMDIWDSIIPA